jgi:radical SAM protein with 4Fe4S-binding SPASM domain
MMKEKAFNVSVPGRISGKTDIVVTIHDRSLLGSPNHILRLDLYPTLAQSHPERHIGYWDVPMAGVDRTRMVLRLTGSEVVRKKLLFTERFPPTWRGSLPMAGPAVLTVSVLDLSKQPALTIHAESSQHVLLQDGDLFPLAGATVQVTKQCNLRCRSCKREYFTARSGGHTPREVLEAVIDASESLAAVFIHADGEPLLNPFVPEMLTKLKERMPRYGRVGVLTNGMRLDQDTARDLVDRGLGWLSVSIDGATKETMETIRRGSRFETIVKNVAFAVEYADRNSLEGVDFTIQFTTHPENVHEIPAMVRLAGQLGVRNLTIGHLLDYETGAYQPQPKEVFAPLIEQGKRIGLQEGVTLKVHRIEPLTARQCPYLDEAVISVSGDVSLCHYRKPGQPAEPSFSIGNLKEKSLQEIWDSASVRELRRRLLSADFPAHCEPCCFSRWGSAVRV